MKTEHSHRVFLSFCGTQLNHFEIKPGVIITATEAKFDKTSATRSETPTGPSVDSDHEANSQPTRLFGAEVFSQIEPQDEEEKNADFSSKANTITEESDATPALELPSRSVLLKHVWDPLAPQEDATTFFSELEEDMRGECSKYGEVEHVHILPNGAVMVRFIALSSAIKCLQVMHHRWFDGRQIHAVFDPSTSEEPEDPDTKLEAFFATLG